MIVFLYFVLMNLVTFLLFLTDKNRAKRGQYQKRIPERTLLLLCFVGGAIGGLFGMYQLRHKTKKVKFMVGVPTAVFLNAIFIVMSIYFNAK
ncbi:MAG TPA: DUF1294 domain-containing protein [Bacilli bacterium]|nr:DUF1294 domain-containing protein [Bacilli bacterium]